VNLDLTDGDYTLAFRQLFHIFHGTQQHDGGYAGKRIFINDDELRRHLTGEIAYGFCVTTRLQNGSGALARFTAFDIDRQFRERLPVFATVLRELGCQRASCTTPGSNPDKGKIIICFDRMIPRHNAYDLGMLVLQKAREKDPALIPHSPKDGDVEVYPKSPASRADGGLLRICGRNIARNGPVETLRDLDFTRLDLAQIVPLREGQIAHRARKYTRVAATANEPAWVSQLINEPWTWASFGGRMGQRRKLTALAHYCDGGETQYIRLLERILQRSPALDQPSPKTKDKRNPIKREIAELSAWRNAQASGRWHPAPIRNAVCVAMVGFVRERGLREHCFGMTSRELAPGWAARNQPQQPQRTGRSMNALSSAWIVVARTASTRTATGSKTSSAACSRFGVCPERARRSTMCSQRRWQIRYTATESSNRKRPLRYQCGFAPMPSSQDCKPTSRRTTTCPKPVLPRARLRRMPRTSNWSNRERQLIQAPRFEELPDLLTPHDLMRYLPVGRNAIYELLNQQRIRNVRVGQKFIIPRTALRDFLEGDVE